METNRKQSRPQRRWDNLLENLFIVILAFYPLRHISWGLDLWDTGYNYANFQYMGTQHMDPMWLFSTYLANVAGNLLTKLPNADSLVGMNLYTGLFVSALALTGYFFCTRKLKMPGWVAFLGEMAAASLCWSPTALLYNYLTYLLFLASTIFVYMGLAREKKGCLILAGALLGSNVLTRFSNLPEMGMIVAVWAYDLIVWLEQRKGMGAAQEGFWKKTVRHTLWCLAGYGAALAFWFSYIHICYGISNYIEGIGRLFAMTETASDYKASSMIRGIVLHYTENLYWVARIGVIIAGGLVLFAAAGWLERRIVLYSAPNRGDRENAPVRKGVNAASPKAGGSAENQQGGGSMADWAAGKGGSGASDSLAWRQLPGAAKTIHIGVRALWAAVSIAMILWLYARNFTSFLFYSYDPIWHPGPMFLMLAMLIALIRIFHRNAPKEEKLISGMVILIILLTPIGSNNGILPSLNNLFLAAPYTLWECWRFLCGADEKRLEVFLVRRRGHLWRRTVRLYSFPVKCILAAFLGLCLFQFGGFGAKFAFAEATGIRDVTATVENNPILKNSKMSPEKARWMQELSAYANENGLQGKEVILYGKIPSLSYYLQMPAAFNPWCDLDSYQPWVMEKELEEIKGQILLKGAEKPVIILENAYAVFAWDAGFPMQGENGRKLRKDMEGMSLQAGVFGSVPGRQGLTAGVPGSVPGRQGLTAGAPGSVPGRQSWTAGVPGSGQRRQALTAAEERMLFTAIRYHGQKHQAMLAEPKWMLLLNFMEDLGYELEFHNAKFSVYR